MDRLILHRDCNCFTTRSCLHHPEICNKPLAVGVDSETEAPARDYPGEEPDSKEVRRQDRRSAFAGKYKNAPISSICQLSKREEKLPDDPWAFVSSGKALETC